MPNNSYNQTYKRIARILQSWPIFCLTIGLLCSLGCSSESPDTGSAGLASAPDDRWQSAGGKNLRPAAAQPAVPSNGLRNVWVQLKDTASLATATSTRDWNARGRAVYRELTATARVSQAPLRAYLDQLGLKYKAYWIVNTLKVEADDATIAQIAQRPDVARVIEDFNLQIPPLQPAVPQERVNGLEWNIENIRASEAWSEFGIRGEGIVVASIDTGAQFDHPALVNQYRGRLPDGSFDHNYNWFDPSNVCGFPSNEPCDNDGHGTHTMGTIVGDDGGENQIGVAPGARWIAAKGCEYFFCSFEALLASGEWILAPTDLNGENPEPDLRPHVVNNSWGGGSGDSFYQGIVQAWVAAGIFPVFSNGNAGPYCGSAGSPADYPESYGVGAYDINEQLAFFSSRGPSFFGITKPNISGPGVDVRSSIPGGDYTWLSGTSMAAPHVTGSVALLWSAALAIAGDVEATRELLDSSAIDRDGQECGGEPENNNAWGQGQLDVFAALEIAPIGPTGTLVGTVGDAEGAPIAGATVAVSGEIDRTTRSDESGAFSLRLPVGSYQVTVNAFGFLEHQTEVVIEDGVTLELAVQLERAPSFVLDGFVTDAEGVPLAGASVTLLKTPLPTLITDEDGYFSFAEVPVGEYTLRVSAGGCYVDSDLPVVVSDTDQSVSAILEFKVDAYGYQCRPIDFDYVAGDTPLNIYPYGGQVLVDLPFPLILYGETYESMWVTSTGYLAFVSDFANASNTAIPNPYTPNAAIYPLWDDLLVRGGVHTTTLGTAPNRQFVIEWRDVTFWSDQSEVANFEVILHETGEIAMYYATADGSLSQGRSATIGLENQAGDIAFQYSFNQALLQSESAVLYEVPFSGLVRGVVTDANDGEGIGGVRVTATDAEGQIRTTTSKPDGSYLLQLTAGSYTLEVTKENYVSASASVEVIEDETVVIDFSLLTARGVINPTTLQFVLPQDTVRTRSLLLENIGSAEMQFEIREAGGSRQIVNKAAALAPSGTLDSLAMTSASLFREGQAFSIIQPAAPGDIVRSFVPSGLGLAWGIGRATDLWLSDIYSRTNFEFTADGVATGLSHLADWSGDWPADMAFDETRGLVCQLAVGGDNGIHCWDPATGEVRETLTGSPWAFISQRGLAYRASDDTFFLGGWNEGIVYHVAGASHVDPGATLSSCRPADGSISGLAYNSAMDVLWMATNSPTDTIYELNPEDCTVLATLAPPQGGSFQGAGLELDEEGNLWAVAQSPNVVYLMESGVPSFGDIPWLSVEPLTGSVAVGGAQTLTVTVDTSGLDPGLYNGTIFILTNSGRQPTLRVPVSLVVSGYLHGINAGGGEYIDSQQDTWEADRAYSPGSYGYVQRGRASTTERGIAGTEDPVLYQSQRVDPYGYRFDNVPNGVYQIDLRFAEFGTARLDQRLFDAIAEDVILLPAHDLAYEVGRFTADDNQFFLEVTEGQLDIRFVQSNDGWAPVINAIRVIHRPDR